MLTQGLSFAASGPVLDGGHDTLIALGSAAILLGAIVSVVLALRRGGHFRRRR